MCKTRYFRRPFLFIVWSFFGVFYTPRWEELLPNNLAALFFSPECCTRRASASSAAPFPLRDASSQLRRSLRKMPKATVRPFGRAAKQSPERPSVLISLRPRGLCLPTHLPGTSPEGWRSAWRSHRHGPRQSPSICDTNCKHKTNPPFSLLMQMLHITYPKSEGSKEE